MQSGMKPGKRVLNCLRLCKWYGTFNIFTIFTECFLMLLVHSEFWRGQLRLRMICEWVAFLVSVIDFLELVHNSFFHLIFLLFLLLHSISLSHPPNPSTLVFVPRCLSAALPVDGSVWRCPFVLHGVGSWPVPPQWLHLHLEIHLPHIQR